VREIIKTPEYVDLIDSIILADSMYAGFANPGTGDRSPKPEHVQSFIDFARLAVTGEKKFLIVYSSIVTKNYASAADCAQALVKSIGGKLKPVKPESLPCAAPELDYPLIARYDKGGLHVWGYGGDTPEAHMAPARTLADFWNIIK
jgi:hypothetical protein